MSNEDKNWVGGYSVSSKGSDRPVSKGMTKAEKETIKEMMDLFLEILGKQHGKGPREREAKLLELKEKL